MSASEISRRLLLAARHQAWRRRSRWEAPGVGLVSTDRWSLHVRGGATNDDLALLLEEAEGILNGSVWLLGCEFDQCSVDWHYDPQLGVRSPLTFGPSIDYRDPTVAGNVKNIWELNRHQHLTALALAYSLTKDERYADAVGDQLTSWLSANPTLQGVNWHSALEAGVRLVSWTWIERLMRGSTAHELSFGSNSMIWGSIYWHQWYISKSMSHGSSSNNHLIGELAGLFVAATVWPYFDESRTWQNVARRSLEREALRQTFPSGLNREQAFSYHLFVLELLIVAGLEAERSTAPFSAPFKDAVRRMVEAIPLLTDSGGHLPRYGDGDDGLAVQLRAKRSSRLDFLYHVARRWISADVPAPRPGSGELAADTAWPAGSEQRGGEFEAPTGSVSFADAGVYVLASNRNTPEEVFCIADAGQLGFLSIAAHGHADALSFTLSIGGRPIIVDPGTFSYFLDAHWREYFRGTRAHNTITLSGENQSVTGGPFLWIREAETTLLDWTVHGNGARLVAQHSGYSRLPGHPVHRRSIELVDDGLDIVDRIEGGGRHELEWRLHFDPACKVTLSQTRCRVDWQGGRLDIALDPQLIWSAKVAADDAGWYSPSFNRKEPTTTLIGKAQLAPPIQLAQHLEVYHA